MSLLLLLRSSEATPPVLITLVSQRRTRSLVRLTLISARVTETTTRTVRLNNRPNAIPNPRAEVDVSGWDWSWVTWSRVTSAPFEIPGPGSTCIYIEPCEGGCGLENSEGGVPLPAGVEPGDYLAVQTAALVAGVTDTDCILALTVTWYDEDGNSPAGQDGWSNIVNDAYWQSAGGLESVGLIDELLPLDGWRSYAANLLVPTELSTGGKPVVAFEFYFTINPYPENPTGANDAALYFTNMLAEPGSEAGTIDPYYEGAVFSRITEEVSAPGVARTLGVIFSRCTRRNYPAATVALTLVSRRQTLRDPQAVTLTMTSRRRTRSVVTLTLVSQRMTVEAARVRLTLTSQRRTSSLARLTVVASRKSHVWQTECAIDAALYGEDSAEHLAWLAENESWRPAMVYPIAQLNGISLSLVDFDPGGEPAVFDEIRHYDGSLVVHDVRSGIFMRSMKVRCSSSTAAGLDAQEEAIKAACKAGGTFTWQSIARDGTPGPVKTDRVAPSDEPSFVRDKTREALLRSYSNLQLRIWPS